MTLSGLEGVLPLLACAHCSGDLRTYGDGVVGCPAGHRFDIAKHGYLSLLGNRSRTDTGDSADMIAARVRFLGAGHYRPVADAIAAQVGSGPVLEIGSGTGYYLGIVLDRLGDNGSADRPVGVALDSSRFAARRAASSRSSVGSIVADAWSALPVRDGVMCTVLSVFAPRDPAEIARVLAPGGRLVVVTPEPEHLAEIPSKLGLLEIDPGKPERLAEAFAGRLQPTGRIAVRHQMLLGREDISALVRMGPAARHVQPEGLRSAIADLDEITAVTVAVTISVLRA